jgi:hypothetical protein
MRHLTLATAGFERYAKTTPSAAFLDAMERVAPWPALCGLIEPYYDDQPELIEITKGAAASDVGGVIAAARCTQSPRSFSCP